MNIFQRPGLHTDVQSSRDLAWLRGLGYEWIVYQTQNGFNPVKVRDLAPAKAAGLKAGVWGCSYSQPALRLDSTALRASADFEDAELIVFNVEFPHDPTPYIETFSGDPRPKALICLVGDLVTMGNSGAIRKLLEAGWQIIGETYTNDQPWLDVTEAEWQRLNAGIPAESFSHAFGMYGNVRGWQYRDQLEFHWQGGPSQNRFSCWMLEQGSDRDYIELAQAITPAAPDTPEDILADIAKISRNNSGVNAVLDRIEKLFDAAGFEEPDGVDALRAYLTTTIPNKLDELVERVNAIS